MATALHRAARIARFDIIEWKQHSVPPPLLPRGEDAAIVLLTSRTGKVIRVETDYRIRNPYKFPVIVKTKIVKRKDGVLIGVALCSSF